MKLYTFLFKRIYGAFNVLNCYSVCKKLYFEKERENHKEIAKLSLISASYIYHVKQAGTNLELFCFVSSNVVILTAKGNIVRCSLFSQLSKYKCTTLH